MDKIQRLRMAQARALAQGDRRSFLMTAAGVGGSAVMGRAQAAGRALEAYADSTSIRAGDGIALRARDPDGSSSRDIRYPLQVVRLGWPDQLMLDTTVNLRLRPVPTDAATHGCDWPISYTVRTRSSWPSGLYLARFGSGDQTAEVPFVLRPERKSPSVKILLQVPFTTLQAYNAYGGKSLYDYNSSAGQRASFVAMDRPLDHPFYRGADPWMPVLVRWLARAGYQVDMCSSINLHGDANVLDGYQLMLMGGHDEYWTREMRNRVDDFINRRGNVVVLGGNTCWFQSRLEPANGRDHRRLVCYKSRSADPQRNEALKTVPWIDLATPWPENTTFGLGSRYGAIWANGFARPPTSLYALQPEHWAFAGTGLGPLSTFGEDLVGYETDACAFTFGADGLPFATGTDGTPANLQILAGADATWWGGYAQSLGTEAQSGHAIVSFHTRNGAVFNAGMTDWALGLQPELDSGLTTVASQITRNVINRLITPYS